MILKPDSLPPTACEMYNVFVNASGSCLKRFGLPGRTNEGVRPLAGLMGVRTPWLLVPIRRPPNAFMSFQHAFVFLRVHSLRAFRSLVPIRTMH
jgi:hypothetical protein